jgi:hypothetical protein
MLISLVYPRDQLPSSRSCRLYCTAPNAQTRCKNAQPLSIRHRRAWGTAGNRTFDFELFVRLWGRCEIQSWRLCSGIRIWRNEAHPCGPGTCPQPVHRCGGRARAPFLRKIFQKRRSRSSIACALVFEPSRPVQNIAASIIAQAKSVRIQTPIAKGERNKSVMPVQPCAPRSANVSRD